MVGACVIVLLLKDFGLVARMAVPVRCATAATLDRRARCSALVVLALRVMGMGCATTVRQVTAPVPARGM